MSERVWTEAKLKAEEMIAAVENASRLLGAGISPEEKQIITELLAELRAALASGEVQRLQKANAALDQATEPLAARLLEHALANAGKTLA
jgi:molecular chaperone DnaK